MAIVALNISGRSVPELIVFARRVQTFMTLQTDYFKLPPVSMTQLEAEIDMLVTAQEKAGHNGSKADTVERNNRLRTVQNSLRLLASYVQTITEGVEQNILLSGMEVKRRGPRRYDTLATPADVNAVSVNNGVVKLRWKPIHNAKSYLVEHAPDPLTGTDWQNGVHNSGANAEVTDLPQGKKYWFRVRAIGSEGLSSDWSEPVCRLVV